MLLKTKGRPWVRLPKRTQDELNLERNEPNSREDSGGFGDVFRAGVKERQAVLRHAQHQAGDVVVLARLAHKAL
jgi:hypothetical protein